MNKDQNIDLFLEKADLLKDKTERTKIVEVALNYAEKSSERSDKSFLHFCQNFRCDGFRRGKATKEIMVRSFTKFENCNENFLLHLFYLWGKSHKAILDAIDEFFDKLKDKTKNEVKDEILRDDNNKRSNDLIKQLIKANDYKDFNEIKRLFLYYILVKDLAESELEHEDIIFETEDNPKLHNNLNDSDNENELSSEKWLSILSSISEIPSTSKDWGEFDNFIAEAQNIYIRTKKEADESIKIENLKNLHNDLLSNYSELINFFEINKLEKILIDDIDKNNCDKMVDFLMKFESHFLNYNNIEAKSQIKGKTLKEEKDRRKLISTLSDIEEQILAHYNSFLSHFYDEDEIAPAGTETKEESKNKEKAQDEGIIKTSPISNLESQKETELIDDKEIEQKQEPAKRKPPTGAAISPKKVFKPPKESNKNYKKVEAVSKVPEKVSSTIEPLFSINHSSSDIANVLKNKSGEDLILSENELVWCLIGEGRISEAHWINKLLSQIVELPIKGFPPWITEFIALSRNLQHSYGPLAARMTELISEYNENIFIGDEEWKNGMRFLLAGTMIRPSILAPTIGSSSILGGLRLKGDINCTYNIINAVTEFGNHGQAISSLYLGTIYGKRDWNDQLEELISEAKKWKKQAPKMSFIYSPATKLWKQFLKPNQLIHEIINPICSDNISKLDTVKELIKNYSYENLLKNLINDTDRSLRKISKRSKAITGKGLTQIVGHCVDSFNLARKWIVLHEQKPDNENQWLTQQIENLAEILQKNTEIAVSELKNQAINYGESWSISTGLKILISSILEIKMLFDNEQSMFPQEEISVAKILNYPLLFTPTIRVDEKMEPINASINKITQELIKHLSKDDFDIELLFKRYCSAKDHEKTELIIEYLKNTQGDKTFEQFIESRRLSKESCQVNLENDIQETIRLIDEAVSQNSLSDIDYSGYISIIESIQPKNIDYFPDVIERLNDIRNELKLRKKLRLSEIQKRLKRGDYKEKERQQITTLLKENDIGTAEEILSLIDAGESITDISTKEDLFVSFFPDFVNRFETYMKPTPSNKSILTKIKLGTTFGPVKMKNVRGAQLEESISPIDKWLVAKHKKTINSKNLSILLDWIGFDIEDCQIVEKAKDRQVFNLNSKLVSLSPVPDYGSLAKGHYRIVCFYGRPPEDVILDQISKKRREGCIIVLYFGRVTETQYRNFAIAIRKQSTGCLIIDESIIFSLLGERGSRLNRLFQLALPFSNNNPYKPFATGNVPPEMFFGRKKERESIIDPHGSCFIYGGRQLGKSALLRAVERSFHRLEEQHYAFFIDLKTEGLGETSPVDDIWKILIKKMEGYRFISNSDLKKDSAESDILQLINWANKDHSRRIILLIDEADKLLDEDAKDNFIRITRMKKIMDETERRIKFVFAGLHNVQRFIRIPNQPLAHLGDPICVGPLLNDGEWREAKNLIEIPTNSLGFRFESKFLINRILSYTNYQPSLIQLFCDTLVKHLSDPNKAAFDQKESPPFKVTARHVDNVYSSTSLRKNIKERFELTLNLDPRYLVIAYIIAHGALSDEEEQLEGFGIPWISKEANFWWNKGFEDSGSIDDLRGLLDEMTGLGVLIQTEENRYKLRSPSVLRLLGNIEDIEHTLLSVSSWELPKKFQSSIFRRAETQRSIHRSPITGTQEADLLYNRDGIRIIYGSKALGIDNVIKYIKLAKSDTYTFYAKTLSKSATDLVSFMREFDTFIKNRKDKMNLFFIPENAPFSEKWIEETHRKIRKLRSKSSKVRTFFITEPESLRSWLKIPKIIREQFENDYAPSISLKKWNEQSIERWLNDLGIAPNSPGQREKIIEHTDGWPILLFRFAHLCANEQINWETALKQIKEEIFSSDGRDEFLKSIGLEKNTFEHKILKIWADINEALSTDDFLTIIDELSTNEVERILDYCEKLCLCKQVSDDKWILESFVADLIS